MTHGVIFSGYLVVDPGGRTVRVEGRAAGVRIIFILFLVLHKLFVVPLELVLCEVVILAFFVVFTSSSLVSLLEWLLLYLVIGVLSLVVRFSWVVSLVSLLETTSFSSIRIFLSLILLEAFAAAPASAIISSPVISFAIIVSSIVNPAVFISITVIVIPAVTTPSVVSTLPLLIIIFAAFIIATSPASSVRVSVVASVSMIPLVVSLLPIIALLVPRLLIPRLHWMLLVVSLLAVVISVIILIIISVPRVLLVAIAVVVDIIIIHLVSIPEVVIELLIPSSVVLVLLAVLWRLVLFVVSVLLLLLFVVEVLVVSGGVNNFAVSLRVIRLGFLRSFLHQRESSFFRPILRLLWLEVLSLDRHRLLLHVLHATFLWVPPLVLIRFPVVSPLVIMRILIILISVPFIESGILVASIVLTLASSSFAATVVSLMPLTAMTLVSPSIRFTLLLMLAGGLRPPQWCVFGL